MVKRFIAVAPKGKEFVFNKNTMIGVPVSSAIEIAKLLTNIRYRIKEGFVWHVYDNDYYYDGYISTEIKRYSSGKMPTFYKYYG